MIRMNDPKFAEILGYLEKANIGTRKEFFKIESADRFLIWWYFYFADDFITPLAEFHYIWLESIFDKNTFIEWFRWSIKTTIVSSVVTYKIANNFCKFINWQSFDDVASTRNTTQIAIKLLNNNVMRDYWKLFTLNWSREELQKKSVGNFDTTNGVKVLATSLGQKLRGAISRNSRPDLLILDDIDVSDSVRNADIIEKNYQKVTWETFGAMTKDWTWKIIFLWNTINQDWIVPRFRKEKEHAKWWNILRQPLIIDWVVQWDFFTDTVIEKIREDEWPRAFNQNYLLIPIDLYEAWLIKEQYLRYYEYINLDDFDSFYMHADTTHTWNKTSDYFCCMLLWENKKDKNYYVIDFVLEKLDVEKQARKTILLYQKYSSKIRKLTYDEKANQWFWFWIKKLAKEEYNLSLPIEELKYPKDKVTHFEPHIPHFIANRIILPSKHKDIKEAETQLLAFPVKGVHDDFVDWLSGVLDNFIKTKKKLMISTC